MTMVTVWAAFGGGLSLTGVVGLAKTGAGVMLACRLVARKLAAAVPPA